MEIPNLLRKSISKSDNTESVEMEGITEAQLNERVKAAISTHNATLKARMEKLRKQVIGNPNVIAISRKGDMSYNQALTDCIRIIEYSEPTI